MDSLNEVQSWYDRCFAIYYRVRCSLGIGLYGEYAVGEPYDHIHDVLCRVWKVLRSNTIMNLDSYLAMAFRNRIIDDLRRSRRYVPLLSGESLPDPHSIRLEAEEREYADKVIESIRDHLDGTNRLLFDFIVRNKLDPNDQEDRVAICSQLGLTPGAFRTTWHRISLCGRTSDASRPKPYLPFITDDTNLAISISKTARLCIKESVARNIFGKHYSTIKRSVKNGRGSLRLSPFQLKKVLASLDGDVEVTITAKVEIPNMTMLTKRYESKRNRYKIDPPNIRYRKLKLFATACMDIARVDMIFDTKIASESRLLEALQWITKSINIFRTLELTSGLICALLVKMRVLKALGKQDELSVIAEECQRIVRTQKHKLRPDRLTSIDDSLRSLCHRCHQ